MTLSDLSRDEAHRQAPGGKTPSSPVALLTTPGFLASAADEATLTFEGAVAERVEVQDVDGDGDFDRVGFFRARSIQLPPGRTVGCLTGLTRGGEPIRGCDTVQIASRTLSRGFP